MIRAGIAIDTWKFPIFERHLSDAGFEYEQAPGAADDTLLLTVQIEAQQIASLAAVVLAANQEAARGRLQ